MYCSPTRRSFLSGRFPVHITGDQAPICSNYLPLNLTLLPAKLKEAESLGDSTKTELQEEIKQLKEAKENKTQEASQLQASLKQKESELEAKQGENQKLTEDLGQSKSVVEAKEAQIQTMEALCMQICTPHSEQPCTGKLIKYAKLTPACC